MEKLLSRFGIDGSWFRPAFWLFLSPLIWPLYLLKFELRSVPFNVLEVVILILFFWQMLLWIGQWWKERQHFKEKLKDFGHQNKWFVWLTLLFLVCGMVGVLIVPYSTLQIDGNTVYESKKVALGIFKGWIVVPYLYFLLMWFLVRQQKQLFTSLYAYLISILPLAIWAFYQYFSGNFITLDGRASGPYINANYLAMYLAPGVAALWVMIVRGVLFGFKPLRFILGMILAILYTVALLMTQSYAAIGAVMIALLVFFVVSWKYLKTFQKDYEFSVLKKIGFFLLTFAVIALVAGLALFVKTEKWRLFTEFQARSSSSVRLQVYQVATGLVRENPWLGVGLGQFQPRYDLDAPRLLGHEPYELIMIHPHNTFLAFWLSLGLGGLILYLWLAARMLVSSRLEKSFELKYFRMIGITMFLVMLLHGLVDTYFFKNDLAVLFWLIAAFCLLPRTRVESN